MQNRDGLLKMYQKLLIEKEQRLRDALQPNRDGALRERPPIGAFDLLRLVRFSSPQV